MKDILKTLILSILAGILISIGGIVYLSIEIKVIGALAFSVGLFFIVECGFKLYTGAIGYALDNSKKDNLLLVFICLGNFLGTLLIALLVRLTRIYPNISTTAQKLVDTKINDTWYSVLVLAFMCGILIYLGVNVFKTSQNNVSKVLAIIYCVVVFILSNYEHCIANMFYFLLVGSISLKSILYITLMIVGNSLGGLFIPLLLKLVKQ